MINCEMIQTKGQVSSANQIVVRRAAAIGDVIAASCVIDKLIDLGYDPVYQTMSAIHPVLRRHPRLRHFGEPSARIPDVNLDGAYERHPLRRRMHFSTLFMERANEQLARFGINLGPASNCKPALRLHPTERLAAQNKFKDYPKPWVFICPRSETYPCRTVPDGIWQEIGAKIAGTKFWLGRHSHAPQNFIDLQARHLDNVIVWLSAADLVVTVDTGPMHIAAALGIPILALGQSSFPDLHLSDCVDYMTVFPAGNLPCLNCQLNVCNLPNRKDNPPCQIFYPDHVSEWANRKLHQISHDGVAAVIPVFGGTSSNVNKCIDHLLNQVQEIIVTAETEDKLPSGITQHGKVRVVVKGVKGIGYARNANFGIRHTTCKFVLCINDDVFLKPDAVAQMKAVMGPQVGIVAGKLFYENGTIYHAGKFRNPGVRAWGHLDLRARDGGVKEPMEVENVNGAAMLIRRAAHFDSGGFDEDYFGYCSDDDTCLRHRQHGWKIIYQPHAVGTHLEGQSFSRINTDRSKMIREGSAMFERKWKWWWDLNLNTVPGNNF